MAPWPTAARRGPIGGSLSRLFGAAVGLRRAAHAAGLLSTERIEGGKVISVGNLRVGGSGKTPFVTLLADRLRDEGWAVSVVLRGYRGDWERVGGVVSTGAGPLAPAGLTGDEASLLARRLPGVRVRVGADRVAAARAEIAAGSRVVVLDDGFQCLRLRRDLDLLLVCPEDLDPRTRLLPAGPLREGPGMARRADLLAGLAGDWSGRPDPPATLLDVVPTALVDPGWRVRPLDVPAGSRAWLLSGIARPGRFADSARRAGFDIAGGSTFADHHRFTPHDIERASAAARAAGAGLLLTTEKDLARLDGVPVPSHLRALRIDLRVVRGDGLLRARLVRALARS